ncbi:amidohydrolase family protein [Bacillus sp. Marseille-P3661]|uniref:amidohydrolase family protein n=1 Tax=Bacillus sp. Marseille-P3661 TaxID=1936234 RepID=UPI001CA5EA75|nr:amidohydrolase family protein [Bacillus sp. Marseille-P3661]
MKAIDTHVHLMTEEAAVSGGDYLHTGQEYFGQEQHIITIKETADYYRKLDMKAVLLATDFRTNTGLPPVSNDHVAKAVKEHPDVFMGFASVDPWMGKLAIQEVERAVSELGLIGLKFQQAGQAFYPNDHRFYPIYEKCQELGIPVLFHMGTTGLGAGQPGGLGIKLKYCRPIYIDDVAADFPNLTIIGAHPGWPWHEELLAIAVHKANVYIDLSGWAPKYIPPIVVQYANSLLQDKVLFGSDWPLLTPERWMKEFDQLNIKDSVKPKIFLENARRVFKLED